ncbi:MAG: pyruvate, phosphate dikinase, partial [Lachnospiraceae bacterium]|nr:pyruvate, phosphate dikinase [Lachnospiraceae bacterium]
ALEGTPVTIRFLDPPLHEFVPQEKEDVEKLAAAQGKSVEEIETIIAGLKEFNPMMGHRGCRLTVTYPEIARMQTKAVIRAAINVQKAHPEWNLKPEIMIPLVSEIKEFKFVKNIVVETADAEIKAAGADLQYEVGTMIEIPRACLTADEIASEADFFCFGTNDLTQMTFGFSRDDAGKFLNSYYDEKIFENDPFAKLDQNGVGKLMKMAIKLGRPVNKSLHIGICGEHGGDPSSVEFCHKIGLDYVSCSPFRVPIARLAAAQAAIAEQAAKAEEKTEEQAKREEAYNEFKDKAQETAKAVAEEAARVAGEAAKVGGEIAKAGFAGLKAGIEEARKFYNDNKK